MATVGKHLRRLRTQRRVTQEELAEKLYVTRQAVSAWETGKAQPDLETLERIAKALNVPVTTLIYGEDSAVKLQQMKKKWMLFGIGISIIMALIFIILVKNGTLLTWKEGFRYQLQSANYSFSYEPLPGSWSVELDMENLESNRGKVLYEDADGCRIVVSEVNKKAPYQYRVFFRTYGVCDREGGTLVSGRVEARALSTSFIGNDWPTATAKAGDLERPCPSAGFSGLNWKDGNQFGFHLSISDDRNERAFSTAYLEAQEGPVVVTITNLTRLRTERLWYWSLY